MARQRAACSKRLRQVESKTGLETSLFDFTLPPGLIAKKPLQERDSSRLLVLSETGPVHSSFSSLPDFMSEGDALVLNETRVMPVRLIGEKPTGGKLDVLLVKKKQDGSRWDALWKGRYTGWLKIGEGLSVFLNEDREAELVCQGGPDRALKDHGLMPLPPYIKRKPIPEDGKWYQTVYASREGSIAAPTAGLHFTPRLLEKLSARGVRILKIVLHVGRGTFMPVKAGNLAEHLMLPEEFEIPLQVLDEINRVKGAGKKIFAVGTTVTRALEGYLSGRYQPLPGASPQTVRGQTDIFIRPGHKFQAVDRLITNFHLPKSTPLVLASALAGRGRLLGAYKEAISLNYRFFSFGDAMLIFGCGNGDESSAPS